MTSLSSSRSPAAKAVGIEGREIHLRVQWALLQKVRYYLASQRTEQNPVAKVSPGNP